MHSENMQIKLVPVSFRLASTLVCKPKLLLLPFFFDLLAYCKNIAYSISEETVQEERKRANSFPSLKIQRPKNFGSPSTFRHELGGNKCFAFFQRLQILPVHATGLNDARSFLRFEKLSNWMCLVYLSKIKRINRPKEDKNKEKVNVQL